MNTIVWIVQIVLALVFAMAGFMKLTQPLENLSERMGWVKDFSPSVVRAIGAVELLGAIGLILPSLTLILPWLTPLAAVGFVLVMIGAIVTHARRKESPMIFGNVVLLLLAAFIIYGRFIAVPLA